MKTGKISEAILHRSVLKEIKYTNEYVAEGPSSGQDAGIVDCKTENIVVSSNPVLISCESQVSLGISRVLNDVAAKGAIPMCITAVFLFPTGYTEKNLKNLMRDMQQCCEMHKVALVGGHTEVTSAVNTPCLTFTCIGKRKMVTSKPMPSQDIYMIGAAGIEGTRILALKKKQEILSRYTENFYEKCMVSESELFNENAILKVLELGAGYVHNLSSGGVLNGLWEMASYGNVGLDIDLRAIPVRQEIIELCELFELNPYQLASGGSFLMTIENSCDIVDILKKNNILAYRIGYTTDKKDRIVRNEDEERYLEEPKPDEILKMI